MTRNKKLMIILVVVLAVGVVATTVGLTSAYWIGASGDSEVAPQTDTTDWNYYIKYFIYEPIKNNSGVVQSYKIVGFDGAVIEDVVVPRRVYGTIKVKDGDTVSTVDLGSGVYFPVTELGNSTFADTTDKAVPVTLTLPTSVSVEPGALMGLSNLAELIVIHVQNFAGNAEVSTIDIGGQYALIGCNSLQKIVVKGDVTINGYAVSSAIASANSSVLTGLKTYLAAPSTTEFEAQ